MEEFKRLLHSRLPGIYNYKEIWEQAAGEVLEYVRELHNIQNQYAVVAKKKQQKTKRKPSLDIYHKGCQECIRSFCNDLGIGQTILWLEINSNRHHVELTFVYCAQSPLLLLYRKLSLLSLLVVNNFREFSFCCSLVLRKYLRTKFLPNYSIMLIL